MSVINAFNFLSSDTQATEEGNKPKEERRHRMDGCHLISQVIW